MSSGYDLADSYAEILKNFVDDIWKHLPSSAIIWTSRSSNALSKKLPWFRLQLQTKLTPKKIKYILEVLIKYVRDASKSSTFPNFQRYLHKIYPELNDVLKKLVETIRLSEEPTRSSRQEEDSLTPCEQRLRSTCRTPCHWDLLADSCRGSLSDDSASSAPRQHHHHRTAPQHYDISRERPSPQHLRSRANNTDNQHAWLTMRHY